MFWHAAADRFDAVGDHRDGQQHRYRRVGVHRRRLHAVRRTLLGRLHRRRTALLHLLRTGNYRTTTLRLDNNVHLLFFLNISVRNQPIFQSFKTTIGAHIW